MESKLGSIMKITAQRLFDKKLIDKTQYERYFVSGLFHRKMFKKDEC